MTTEIVLFDSCRLEIDMIIFIFFSVSTYSQEFEGVTVAELSGYEDELVNIFASICGIDASTVSIISMVQNGDNVDIVFGYPSGTEIPSNYEITFVSQVSHVSGLREVLEVGKIC